MAVQQVLVLFFILAATVHSAKILVMVSAPSRSLFNIYSPLIEVLSARKHDVTVQSFYPLKKPIPSVKEMPLKLVEFGGNEEMTKDLLLNLGKASPISATLELTDMLRHVCEEYITDESTKNLLNDGKQFDLAIVDGFQECSLVVAAVVAKQSIDVLGSGNFPWLYSDAPVPPSYLNNFYRRVSSKMTFWGRMMNAIDVAAFRLINDYQLSPAQQEVLNKYIPQAPTIEEAHERVALTITNGDPVMYSPRPSVPSVVECGALHCTTAQPLPKELNDFVESSGNDGFIMFGLGTNMKSKFLPPEVRDAILDAFSHVKQKVIWKFEAQLDNVPKNVKITNWMPQQDLLGHPKCRLFITHSGLLSLQEAIYHGVPVIGMPFFADQPGNIGRIQELGIGEHLDFSNITADGLYYLINKVLTTESYRANARKYSVILKDQPTKPLDRAIFWIEYVLRHDGARHFRPASRDLYFFQYFLLDVIGYLSLVVVLTIGTIVYIIKLTFKTFFAKKKSSSTLEKKQK